MIEVNPFYIKEVGQFYAHGNGRMGDLQEGQ